MKSSVSSRPVIRLIREEGLSGDTASEEAGGACQWQFGGAIPKSTSDFGRNSQYGSLLLLTYLAFGGHGATLQRYNDFRAVISNPC